MSLKRHRTALSIAATLVFLAASREVKAQQPPPQDLRGWGLHCFCLTARHTPQRAATADDNGKLLWLAREGASLRALRQDGLQVTDSQILLLRTYGLLEQDGDRVRTAFPVLGPDIMIPLRARLRKIAGRVARELRPDVRIIAASLEAGGTADRLWTVVFGYALDGLFWDELRRRDALPDTTLDLDHPIWRGAFWAIYPERSGVPGTNEIALADSALVAVWTDRTVDRLNAALDSHKNDASAPAGELIINNRLGDPIHDAAARIATTTAAAILDSPDGQQLVSSIRGTTRQTALLILTHELIWDITDALVESGNLARPAVLDKPSPGANDLSKLMFVRRPR
jgi:hypothetical protein